MNHAAHYKAVTNSGVIPQLLDAARKKGYETHILGYKINIYPLLILGSGTLEGSTMFPQLAAWFLPISYLAVCLLPALMDDQHLFCFHCMHAVLRLRACGPVSSLDDLSLTAHLSQETASGVNNAAAKA